MPRPVSDQQVFLASGTANARIAIIDLAIPRGTVDPTRDQTNALVNRNFFVRFFNNGSTNLVIQFRESDTFTGGFTLVTGTNLTIAGKASNEVEFSTAKRYLELFGNGNVQFTVDLQSSGDITYHYGAE